MISGLTAVLVLLGKGGSTSTLIEAWKVSAVSSPSHTGCLVHSASEQVAERDLRVHGMVFACKRGLGLADELPLCDLLAHKLHSNECLALLCSASAFSLQIVLSSQYVSLGARGR